MKRIVLITAILLSCGLTFAETTPGPQQYVYVAPMVKHLAGQGFFTTFAFTNTTHWWFNPVLRLVDSEGQVVQTIAPLLKGFGTWQGTTHDILPADSFQGSIWLISSQPLVGYCFLHQLKEDGSLQLLASASLELVAQPETAPIPPAAVSAEEPLP